MRRAYLIVSLLLACAPLLSVAAPEPAAMWRSYNTERSSTAKLTLLTTIAAYYSEHGELKAMDSTLNMSVDIARMLDNDTLLMATYITYFKLNREEAFEKDAAANAVENAANMLSLARDHNNNEWYYSAYAAKAQISDDVGKRIDAIDQVSKAHYYVNLTDNNELKIDCYLLWGSFLEATNNKIDAFRNYLNALNLAQKHQDKKDIYECYSKLSNFYLLIGNYERARDYKLKQFGLLNALGADADSLRYMKLLSDLSVRYYYNKERVNAEKLTHRIISYAMRTGNDELLKKAGARHFNFLAENSLFADIASFYQKKYPNLLSEMAANDTEKYYRVMAFISEVNGDIGAAHSYFQRDETALLAKDANTTLYIRYSNFLKRYAQFLFRNGDKSLAKQKMEASYQAAKQADYLPYLAETSALLDTIYYKEGNIAKAYEYAALHTVYNAQQEKATRQDALLQMEIDNETRQRALLAEQEREETEHRHNVQYTGIIVGIVCSFIILLMVGSFKVPKIVIQSLGAFSFIFFFEFVTLLLDHKIMHLTHSEPWKMLGIKIIIISMMLPFHHWLEHKVIHYLVEHQLIDTSKLSPRRLFIRKPKVIVEKEELEN